MKKANLFLVLGVVVIALLLVSGTLAAAKSSRDGFVRVDERAGMEAGFVPDRPLQEVENDLGDAPDSTNHTGAPMTAYPAGGPPGTPANFPTVFDPATGFPQGPLHFAPRSDSWLGPWVSLEHDADLLPDTDGPTNIDPPSDFPDQDGFDDGVWLPVATPHCASSFFTYTVTITSGAYPRNRYVNVWFDWNRDGDWADTFTCAAPNDAPEWAVQNRLHSMLSPGTYVFATPAYLPYNTTPEQPIWMRISIAELQAPLDPYISLADGRGPANGYSFGETEDYYLEGQEPPPVEWGKWINDIAWTPGITFSVETSDTIEVVDVITSPFFSYKLQELWNPDELDLLDYSIDPTSTGVITPGTGSLVLEMPPNPPKVVTMTKYFHVEPSTWEVTFLDEILEGPTVPDPARPVIFQKFGPVLSIDSVYSPDILAGSVATFTLDYRNDGGYENDVMVRNDFPDDAPFLDSTPPPDRTDPGGAWVEWDVGDLAGGNAGSIDVSVAVAPGLAPSTTVVITDVIYNHVDMGVDVTYIRFHVDQTPYQEGDIYIKDNDLDDGFVPSALPWWMSHDIWVRTDGDCTKTVHQNPAPGTNNTICVRVRNRMATVMDDITVDLYWGSAAVGLHWPGSWSPIGSVFIPSLPAGGQVVKSLVWHTPGWTGHFCLLARADAPADPVGSGPDTVAPADRTRNNNNIAQKNLTIIDYPDVTQCGYYNPSVYTDTVPFDAVNTTGDTASVDLVFDSQDFPLGIGNISLDPGALWGRWTTLSNFNQVGQTLIPTGFPALVSGIAMGPFESVGVTMTISIRGDIDFAIKVTEALGGATVGGIEYLRDLPDCVFMPVMLYKPSTPLVGWLKFVP